MVRKSSSLISMHILRRRSSEKSISQALAWHTTSRSRGLTNMERCQKDSGSGENPGEVVTRIGVLRRDEGIDIAPVLGPHVAQQIGGDGTVGWDYGCAVVLT